MPQPSTPLDRPSRPTRRRGPWRWLVAAVATIALVVSGSGLIAFAQTGAGAGRGPIFVPADAPVYVEARVDMPDGQDEALAQMLTAFPGFADSASLQTRIDEALDGMLAEASDGEVTFSEDISPWITGEVGLGVMDLSSAMASGEDPDFILGIGVSDTDAASRFVTLLLEQGGMELAEEQYGGFTIYTGGDDDVEVGGQDAALAVTDEFLLVATGSDLIRHSIDVLGGAQPSLAQDEQFQAGFARVPAGRLAAVWFDVAAFADLVAAAMAMGAQPGPGGEMAETLLQQLPQDMTMYLAAMPDGLTIEAFVTPAEGGIVPPVGQSDLAARFPATTQLYVETRDLGATVESSLQGLTSTMGSEAAEELEPIEGLLGVPLPQILDFVEDAALGAAVEDGGAWVGIAGEVTDETVAQERLERVLGAIGMAAASEDTGVEITETEVAGTTVTTFTLPEEATEDLPIGIGDTISVAVGDGMLLLGTGTFVADALTSDGTDSLGTSEGYVSALGTATSNSSVLYADIAGLLTTLDPLLSFVVDDWENISPWVQGLDRFVAVGTADEEVISARMTLYVAAAS